MTWRIRNWRKFQHFKDRSPPWIKLYADLVDDPDWHELDGDSAKGLVMLWMIASKDGGNLPSIRKLSFRLRTTEHAVSALLSRLSKHWLEQDDINPISDRYHDDAPEKRREEKSQRQREILGGADIIPISNPEPLPAAPPKTTEKVKKASRLPDDWEPEIADIKKAYADGLTEDEARREFEKFKDYWRARAGSDARKLDWNATFRNWMRKASDDKGRRQIQDRQHQRVR